MSKPKSKQHRANQASVLNIRIAPRKARVVVDLVRNKHVEEALQILQFTPKKASPVVAKLIESAIHNVTNSEQLDWDTDDLYVAQAYVNEGPTLRRFTPRAQGRATRINKRTSQITVVLQPRG
ncbi:MAG: 50S ribosomal protein L22 [Bradymonadaceae bacterium]|nr:50S ribosomal protein L22 [Lujinxingiaceae bacterium]